MKEIKNEREQKLLPELLLVRLQLQVNQNHVKSVKNVSNDAELMDLRYVEVLYYTMVNDLDLTDPLILL